MDIAQFLNNLFADGRVGVGPPGDNEGQAAEVLVGIEKTWRWEFPGEAPEFSVEAGDWAARQFYRACQATIYRDLDAAALDHWLDVSPPTVALASRHYSVDLVFHFLPDLLKIAGQLSPDDPLVAKLRGWASQWPLSSVGVKDVLPVSLDGIVDHPGLLQLYADRIIARRDHARLAHPVVWAAVRKSVGLQTRRFPELGLTSDNAPESPARPVTDSGIGNA